MKLLEQGHKEEITMNKTEWSNWINASMEKAAIYGPLGRYDSDVIKVDTLRTLINMIGDKDPIYFVKEPITGQFLIRDSQNSLGVKWVDGFSTDPSYFTEQELKDIAEEYWDFAERFEG